LQYTAYLQPRKQAKMARNKTSAKPGFGSTLRQERITKVMQSHKACSVGGTEPCRQVKYRRWLFRRVKTCQSDGYCHELSR
jgi:hypothetical protein